MAQPFPDDELRRLLRWLVRVGGLLEPHDHDGVRASASEVFALAELAEAGPLSQQQLGERLGLEKSTVSRLAAGLERRGWLERVRDPANRRFYRLALTPAGAARPSGSAAHFSAQHHRYLFAELTDEERNGSAARDVRAGPGDGGTQHHHRRPRTSRGRATSATAAAGGQCGGDLVQRGLGRQRATGRHPVGHHREHQQPPVGAADQPGQRADPVQGAGLGPDLAGRERRRTGAVAVVQRAEVAGHRQPGHQRVQPRAGPAPAAVRSSAASSAGVTRSWADSPLPSSSWSPAGNPSRASTYRVAATAPAKLAGRPSAIATCRASASATTLSEASSICSTSRGIGCELTSASVVAPAGAAAADHRRLRHPERGGQRAAGLEVRRRRSGPAARPAGRRRPSSR